MREINEGAKVNANSFFVNIEDINLPNSPSSKKEMAPGDCIVGEAVYKF
jgi:hypothetical protein